MPLPDPNTLRHRVQAWLDDVDHNGVNAEVASRWMHPDLRVYFNSDPAPLPLDAYIAAASGFYSNFSDITHTIHHILIDGDKASIWSTVRARHTGPFLDIAPTGRSIAVAQSVVVRFSDNLIIEEWVHNDMATLLAQLSPGA
jgi:predicted ester cyclase